MTFRRVNDESVGNFDHTHNHTHIQIRTQIQTQEKNYMAEEKFDKLSRDDKTKTRIITGNKQFTVDQLEKEIKKNSEIGRKLKSIEKKL